MDRRIFGFRPKPLSVRIDALRGADTDPLHWGIRLTNCFHSSVPHFIFISQVKEFACSDGTDTIFISSLLVSVLQHVRDHYGKAVHINSAYRTEAHNKKIGGAAYSQHKYGIAADIHIDGVKPKELAAYIETLIPTSGGIGIYSSFVHVDVRRTRSRWNG